MEMLLVLKESSFEKKSLNDLKTENVIGDANKSSLRVRSLHVRTNGLTV